MNLEEYTYEQIKAEMHRRDEKKNEEELGRRIAQFLGQSNSLLSLSICLSQGSREISTKKLVTAILSVVSDEDGRWR